MKLLKRYDDGGAFDTGEGDAAYDTGECSDPCGPFGTEEDGDDA